MRFQVHNKYFFLKIWDSIVSVKFAIRVFTARNEKIKAIVKMITWVVFFCADLTGGRFTPLILLYSPHALHR